MTTEIIGITFAILGAVASLSGSWLTSSANREKRRVGFVIWVCENPFNIVFLGGIILGWWSSLPLVLTLVIQCYFLMTAARGYLSNCEVPVC